MGKSSSTPSPSLGLSPLIWKKGTVTAPTWQGLDDDEEANGTVTALRAVRRSRPSVLGAIAIIPDGREDQDVDQKQLIKREPETQKPRRYQCEVRFKGEPFLLLCAFGCPG